jgi:acetate kinase
MRVLVVNAGSSTLKLSILDSDDRVVVSNDVSADDGRFGEGAIQEVLAEAREIDAVGHRIVHGGTAFHSSVVMDSAIREQLRSLTDLAPLHQPKSLAAFDIVTRLLPSVPAVACFDTAFHASLPARASTYAIPREWRQRLGVRRFGFHGLSHAYAARRACELADSSAKNRRVVTCHLGAGASLAAVLGGVSVDTTMGFTPLEGLVMATRSGNIDPGALLWLLSHARVPVAELADAVEHRSGLLGLAGTSDMKGVLQAAREGDSDATLAVDVYVHRLCAGIASMVAAMNGLDVLVFTGGVGENASEIRARAARALGFLGVQIDEELNARAAPDCDVTAPQAPVRTVVVRAREDLEIAREVRRLLD